MDEPQALAAPPQSAPDLDSARGLPHLPPEHAEVLVELLLRTSSAGVALLDRELRFVRVNARMAEIDRLPASAHLGRALPDILPVHAATLTPLLRRALESGQPVTGVELTIENPPGRPRTFAAGYFPLVVGGAAEGILVSLQETGDARRAETTLREPGEMLSLLVDNIAQTFYVDDAEGNTLYVSPAYAGMFGRSAESLYADPRSFLASVHPDDRPRLEAALPRARTGTLDLHYRIVRPDGSVRRVRDRLFPVTDGDGRVVRSAGIVEDVTLEHEVLETERLLAEAGQVLSASLDLDATLRRTTELLVPRFGDLCVVMMRDEAGVFRASAWRHADAAMEPQLDEMVRTYHPRPGDGTHMGAALETGEPAWVRVTPGHIARVAEVAPGLRLAATLRPTSSVIVPLAARGQIIGVILVSMTARTGRRHTDAEYRALREVAERAALALENARLYGAEHRARAAAEAAAERTRRLQALTAALARAATPADAASAVLEQGIAALDAAAGGLSILTPDEDALELVALQGFTIGTAERNGWLRFPLSAPLAACEAVLHRRVIFLRSIEEWRRDYPTAAVLMERSGLHAYAVAPLEVEGRALGAVGFNFREPRDFTADDEAFVTAIARQAGQALERARLFAAEHEARAAAERSAAAARRLQGVTAALSEAATPREVAEVIVVNGAEALGAAGGSLAVLEPGTAEFRMLATTGYPEPVAHAFEHFPLQPGRPVSDAVLAGAPVLLATLDEVAARYPEIEATMRATGFEAYAAVPILRGDTPLAGLSLSFRGTHRFGDEERAFLRTLAEQAGQALERSRLYEAERHARAEAEAANRAKTEFLAVMSHELRTPLNAIAGYAELIAMGIRGPVTPEQAEDLARIQRSQRHLLGLINDVLNFARIEAGRVELHLDDVAVDAALADVESLVAPQVRERGLRYEHRPADPRLRARADAEKLRQVLLNVLSNAVKFTAQGGSVTLDAHAAGDAVHVRVIDTGIGIPRDRLESIFEPFVQLGRNLSSRHEGTGLGLAISRDLARAMGGDLSADSDPGAGSTFTLTLPRAPDPPP